MVRRGLCGAAVVLLSFFAVMPGRAAVPDFAGEAASPDAAYAVAWALAGADNQGMPFVVVDKRGGRVYAFDAEGGLVGTTPALLGLAIGDRSVPDIARRTPASLRPHERTTPAGRFVSQPGHNDKGEAIVWVDYGAAVAIHRLRPSPAAERRRERLVSASAADKRISLGCIVVPVTFYENVVEPLLGRRAGVVYVLPEDRPVREMFNDTLQFGLR